MKFLADQSIDGPIVAAVRRDAHEVLYIAELSPGIPDTTVLTRANEAEAILLTADKDFEELVFRQRQVHCGVVLLRLFGYTPEVKAEIVASAIPSHSAELEFQFTVVTGKSVRIRHIRI